MGCGTGLLLDILSIPPERYLGIDTSEGMLEIAREKHPAYNFQKMNMENVEFFTEGEKADNIISLFGVFSYSTLPRQLLEEFNRILRPGGKIFIMAYTKKHRKDHGYLVKDMNVHIMEWSSSFLSCYAHSLFNYTIKAWNIFGFRIPQRIGRDMIERYYRFEQTYLAERYPDKGTYLILEGVKKR